MLEEIHGREVVKDDPDATRLTEERSAHGILGSSLLLIKARIDAMDTGSPNATL